MLTQPTDDRNSFLAELSAGDYELFRPHLTSLSLTVRERLQEFGTTVERVVFPHGGLVALTMPLRDRGANGAILVGRDGMIGAFGAVAAAPAGSDAEVYVTGRAARISASAFRNILDQSPTIRRLVARYNATLIAQAHQTALCNAAHPVQARISRYLLEAHDRCAGKDIPLTQSTLAQMLGVQRTTVNQAAARLGTDVIKCRRGCIQIVRREQLERHACECYLNFKSYASRLFAVPVAAAFAGSAEHSTASRC
jgi:CRP-like cAMP-binding protein